MSNEFGGLWTHVKLEVLNNYLNAYVNVFKNQPYYKLIYIDAFAGTGECNTRVGTIDGSAKIALNVPRFNEYIFIELDSEKVVFLEKLKSEYPKKKITIINGDCNEEIRNVIKKYNWKYTRAVSFLDPFKMELSFETLKHIANTKAFDMWYLFPIGQATRSLRKDGQITKGIEEQLNNLFGDNNWKENLYYEDPQINLFDDNQIIRKSQKDICCYFRKKLQTHFSLVTCPLWLRNSINAPLFLLYFAAANEKGKTIAQKISEYIIKKEQTYVCDYENK